MDMIIDFINSFFADPEGVLTSLFRDKIVIASIIIFLWCTLEGETALILAGLAAHGEHIHIGLITFIAGCGGFLGDQIYFYIGRYSKSYIRKKLKAQRRKFAVAQILLQKYGWPIIFIQRYMYGFRTVIPMSIGLTNYSAKKFGIINFISAQVWAAITIFIVYIFGEQIWAIINWAKEHWYLAAILVIGFLCLILYAFKSLENKLLNKKGKKNESSI
ncbi:DedA family protein [Campylobacter sp. RM9334]|uniref:DedA family protein n=1 Tax=Campylobacter sp. RM9334 TaxID=2735732 RepID=UPI0030156006